MLKRLNNLVFDIALVALAASAIAALFFVMTSPVVKAVAHPQIGKFTLRAEVRR